MKTFIMSSIILLTSSEKLYKILLVKCENPGESRKRMKSYNEYLIKLIDRKRRNPWLETFKIIIFYLLSGLVWIFLSDRVLKSIVRDEAQYMKFQLYKGWMFVFFTAIIFYFIILQRMRMYKRALDEIHSAYEELSVTSEELIALDEELNQQNEALLESEERYKLAVEVASDGIWDWNIADSSYFFTIIHNPTFGYPVKEKNDNTQDWEEAVHPEDKKKTREVIQNYLKNPEGILEYSYRIRTINGEYRWLLSTAKAILDDKGIPVRITGTHKDITKEKEMEKQLHAVSYFDYLTGLPNRFMFEQEVTKLLEKANNTKKKIGFVYLDIDNINHINDIMGHSEGDRVIKKVGKTLSTYLGKPNFIARLGGDEFGVVLLEREHASQIEEDIKATLNQIRENWILDDKSFLISASVGIAIYPDHGLDYDTLMKNADTAMFKSKADGKGKYLVFNQEMHEETLKFVNRSSELRTAIQEEEFVLYYQPQVDIRTSEIVGAEALIRWNQPEVGFVPPGEFIPFAEKIGYIEVIENWVLRTAFEQKKKWQEKGLKDFKLSVNLSSQRLTQPGLVECIRQILIEKEMDARGIELEITETAVIDDLNKAISTLNDLRDLGFHIALDDFGTGHSSLTYLQKLPIDILKIDRKFIMNVMDEDEEVYIFKMIVDLAHNLNLKVVAEGVETKQQLAFLKKNSCDIAQGYYFERPIPVLEFEQLLEKAGRY